MVRNLMNEADGWIRNMESGCYPREASGCDPELKAEVVRRIRERLAKGSQPIRKFIDQHAMAVIMGDPVLTGEYVALIDATRGGKLRSKLDDWAVSIWERYPVLPKSRFSARGAWVREASLTDSLVR